MKDKVIVTDMDDVLVDLLSEWIDHLNSSYNLKVQKENVTDWDMHKSYPTLSDKALYGCLYSDSFWAHVKPKPYAVETLEKLHGERYVIYVATAAHHNSIKAKIENALLPYFPFLSYKNIIMCHDKGMLQCDYIIDDNPDNLKNSSAIRFLVSAPYNKNCDKSYYDFRIDNLQDFYEQIKKLD